MKAKFKAAIGIPTRFLDAIYKALTHFSIDHPVVIIALTLAVMLLFTIRIGTLRFETDITNLADGSTRRFPGISSERREILSSAILAVPGNTRR
ncbi:MAG TPA: hypothetical protein DCE14_01065 [Kosmotogaceae bacterium]|nr:hypothetical protein [Kosmotogaceae bacterium]